MHIKTKAATLWRLAFSLAVLIVITACEDPSSIGGEFADKSALKVDTVLVDNLTSVNYDAYLGKLNRSATGTFQDDLFGTQEAFSFLKPALITNTDSLVLDAQQDTLELRLNMFLDDFYGDTTSTVTYNIYRVNELWRGTTYRRSDSLTYDDSEVIGQFTDADLDTNGTVEVMLGGSWKSDYATFFNSEDENKEENYRNNEYGLAIVAEAGTPVIRYFDLSGSSMAIIKNGEEELLEILDWGYDVNQSGGLSDPGLIHFDTFSEVYKFNLEEHIAPFSQQNIVRAEFILNVDTLALQNSLAPNEVRTPGTTMGMVFGPDDDIDYEIGFGVLDTQGFNTSPGNYVFSLTSVVNSFLFSNRDISEAYVYLLSNQGYLSHRPVYSKNNDAELAPRIIIYSLEPED